MSDIHGESFTVDSGFAGLQLTTADSGRVIERCVFDARTLLPARAAFAASHDNWLMCDAPATVKVRDQGRNNRVNMLVFGGYPKT